jgi:hypothetical protein
VPNVFNNFYFFFGDGPIKVAPSERKGKKRKKRKTLGALPRNLE